MEQLAAATEELIPEPRKPLTVDDAQLLRLAAEPPRHAARILERSGAFFPIAGLLLFVLPILGAACAAFGQPLAIWGLKGLAVRRADGLEEVLIPGLRWLGAPYLYAPPLQAWLTAGSQFIFPEGDVAGLLAVSVVSLIVAGFALTFWVWRVAGGPTGLMTALLLAVHAQWLLLTVTGSSGALTLGFLVLTGWSLFQHIQQAPPSLASLPLLFAGLFWGAAVLSGGSMSVAFLLVLLIWCCLGPLSRSDSSLESVNFPSTGKLGFWSLLLLIATGIAAGGWWWAMMFERYGWELAGSWYMAPSNPDGIARILSKYENDHLLPWLLRSAFLSGVGLLGLGAGLSGLLGSRHASPGRLRELMTVWFLLGLILRLFPLSRMFDDPSVYAHWTRNWESFCVIPATCLAADGLVRMLSRDVSLRGVVCAISVTTGCVVATTSRNWTAGWIVGGTVGLLLVSSAPLSAGLRRTTLAWSEGEQRRGIQVFGLIVMLGHGLTGGELWWQPVPGRRVYEIARARLMATPSPEQVSLITSDSLEDPSQVEYLTRSLFPRARWTHSIGWDPALTDTIVAEYLEPKSHMLVVEWGRRELRFRADIGTGWQVRPVIDPTPYWGRRLAANLIEPIREPAAISPEPDR